MPKRVGVEQNHVAREMLLKSLTERPSGHLSPLSGLATQGYRVRTGRLYSMALYPV
ncbi:hypothetical protein MLPF_2941 [Mycobacterium lepromatosis]|nr:hypothetical protein MLPF_2941 [Mycobacterium lepromatosis]